MKAETIPGATAPAGGVMVAFHGSADLKEFYLERVKAHRLADQLTQGLGWDGRTGKGCAVGCTLNEYRHSKYPEMIGVPETLAYLQDAIFEGLPKEEAMAFPEQFLSAIPVGADLSLVWWKCADRMLNRAFTGVTDTAVLDACAKSRDLVRRASIGDMAPSDEWAWAAWAAEAAARVAWVAWAAWAAARAAGAAAEVARAAWAAAEVAGVAARAARVAGEGEYRKQRDDLLELLAAAPIVGVVDEKGGE